ncbi:MAG: hypothetical protein V7L20_26645 [Nostoc sp.]|uniref:hypothetical protein n=1 Tax=Nostoc sp. TaxID=1180 RepID=UPI002FF78B3C
MKREDLVYTIEEIIMRAFDTDNLIGKTIEEAEKLLVNTGCKLSVITRGHKGGGWVALDDGATIHVDVQDGIISETLRKLI